MVPAAPEAGRSVSASPEGNSGQMKTPEEALQQWICDQIDFGSNDPAQAAHVYTRDSMVGLAKVLNYPQGSTRLAPTLLHVLLARSASDTDIINTFQKHRVGGPVISGQFLAQFNSFEELVRYFRVNGWLPQSPQDTAPTPDSVKLSTPDLV